MSITKQQNTRNRSLTDNHRNNKALISSFSNNEHEQQLRSLLALVEQYNQHYNQMLEEHHETIKGTNSFNDFIQKIQAKQENQIQSLYDGLKTIRRMLEELLAKSINILPEIIQSLVQGKNKYNILQEQLDDKQLIIQGLKQRKVESQKHLNQITMMFEKSRHDNMQLNEKMNRKQQEFQNQSTLIRKTFLQVTESSQAEKKILQQLYESNQRLNIGLNQAKNQKKQIQKQMYKITLQLNKSRSKVQALEAQIQKRQIKIKNYESQLQSLHTSHRKKSTNSVGSNPRQQQDHYLRQSFTDMPEDKKNDKIKLNQQLCNYKLPTVKQLNGSFIMGTGIKRSVGEQSDYASQYEQTKVNQSLITQNQQQRDSIMERLNRKKDINDPYFSHYILISQSVKIKEDCQDMLNIDMKPYYQQIIDKRIPMHLWDQWIKNRLRELLRKNDLRE